MEQKATTAVSGNLNHKMIYKNYLNADIFILPSVTAIDGDQEGTPMVLLEAQSMGLPVISTKHSGIPEIVIDQKSGYLIKEKDVDSLVEKLEILMSDPNKRRDFGIFGKKFIEQHFDLKKLNENLINIYKNLLL